LVVGLNKKVLLSSLIFGVLLVSGLLASTQVGKSANGDLAPQSKVPISTVTPKVVTFQLIGSTTFSDSVSCDSGIAVAGGYKVNFGTGLTISENDRTGTGIWTVGGDTFGASSEGTGTIDVQVLCAT